MTKQAKLSPGAIALGVGGGLAAGGLIAAGDVKKGLEELSARNMARRRAMGFRGPVVTPRYGYGALKSSVEGLKP